MILWSTVKGYHYFNLNRRIIQLNLASKHQIKIIKFLIIFPDIQLIQITNLAFKYIIMTFMTIMIRSTVNLVGLCLELNFNNNL